MVTVRVLRKLRVAVRIDSAAAVAAAAVGLRTKAISHHLGKARCTLTPPLRTSYADETAEELPA